MNIYEKKQLWKTVLLVSALLIGAISLIYTRTLVKKLSEEEKKKVELWAKGTEQLANINDSMGDFSFAFEVVKNNTTVPVILTDDKDNLITFRNLDSLQANNPEYIQKQLKTMKSQHDRIEFQLAEGVKNYIYYKDSVLLNELRYYPYFQLGVITLFLLVSYFAFSESRKAEQNQVWIGMAKETAHQLGTPLSSLIAWLELIKMKGMDSEMTAEIEKDIQRFNTITERFSKIGAVPALKDENLNELLQRITNYIKSRTSSKVTFYISMPRKEAVLIPLNAPLFEWVLENLFKNAIDAMNGSGSITISVTDLENSVYIDVTDTGSGMPKSRYKTIFKPGYTTKSRGWGLGLSLAKRIVEDYHSGRIFVKSSEAGKGTTFRIILNRKG